MSRKQEIEWFTPEEKLPEGMQHDVLYIVKGYNWCEKGYYTNEDGFYYVEDGDSHESSIDEVAEWAYI